MNLNRNISFYNTDSEQFIKQYSDNEFNLAFVDCPYGINDFVGVEKDKEYFDDAVAWFNKDTYAPLFQKPKIEQLSIAV